MKTFRLFLALLALLLCVNVGFAHNDGEDSDEDTPNEQGSDDSTIDPIGFVSGNMRLDEVDIVIPCPLINLAFYRSYNSNVDSSGALGRRWQHSYGWRLAFKGTEVTLHAAADPSMGPYGGYSRDFKRETNGTYRAVSENDHYLEELESGDFEVRAPGGMTYLFDASGVFQQISHAAGPNVMLSYTNGLLSRVEHSNGQALDFAYTNRLIQKITTPSPDLSISFYYSGQNVLTNVIRSTSRGDFGTSYKYSSRTNAPDHARMTRKINANGDVFRYKYANIDGYDSKCTGMYIEPEYYKVVLRYKPPQEIKIAIPMTQYSSH